MDRLGLAPKQPSSSAASALGKDQIYNEKYEDDDDDDLMRMGPEDDEEDRRRQEAQRALQDRYLQKGLASMGGSRAAVRGETDDFDDDGEGSDDEDERPYAPRALSPDAPSYTHQTTHIKAEPVEDDVSLFAPPTLSVPGPSSPHRRRQPSTSSRVSSPLSLRLPTPPPRRDVKEYWPTFSPTKVLDFTDFFAAPRRKKRRVAQSKPVKLRPTEGRPASPTSTRELALQPLTPDTGDEIRYINEIAGDLIEQEEIQAKLRAANIDEQTQPKVRLPPSALELPELDDWESRIMTDELVHPTLLPSVEHPVNRSLNQDDWTEAIIWSSEDARDPRKVELNSRLILDFNDEEMMIEEVTPENDKQRMASSLLASSAPMLSRRAAENALHLDPLNMSNDGFYELSREQRQRIQRQTLGGLVVQHTKVARKLQLPFYKTRLTKVEARSFHRPALQFPINIPLSFSRVEKAGGATNGSRKKDKKRSKDVDEVIRNTRELTLKEQGAFVLYEYSEEHPPVLSKIGMGSILVNYYRKKDVKDEHIPKADLGEPFILEPNDESPFLKFGSVEPGQVQPTLYNNLVRAPLFRHQPATTDFLLVRSTTKNHVRYYLRDIKNLFVVGQNYPLAMIPGPHARLVTNAIRNRLVMVARRLIEQSKGNRIKIYRIMKYFPDQSELQMRQRLKEFMEYARKAGDPNQGFWRLRQGVSLPTDLEFEKLIPPEHICLSEAMQAGQRQLLDAGYTRAAEGMDDDDDPTGGKSGEGGLDTEQLLAPWITSKNFLMATQGKAMLRLHGEGDPTGRGEGFSFVRVSMKDVFYKAGDDTDEARLAVQLEEEKRSGHKYNVARQQQIYREEIERIWNAQKTALSNPVPPELTYEEANPAPTPEPEEEEADEEDAEEGRTDRKKHVEEGKVLRIKRQVNGRWQTEIVRDHKVIQSYIASRQRIADEETTTESLVPTGDAALDASRRKRLEEEIASRKRNQERRLARHHAKAVAEGKALPGAYKKLMADKPTTSRKCGRCGQVGHMNSNRSCPLYGQVPGAGSTGVGSAGAGMPTTAGGGPLGIRPALGSHDSGTFNPAAAGGAGGSIPSTPVGGSMFGGGPGVGGAGGPSFFPPTHARAPSFSGGAMSPSGAAASPAPKGGAGGKLKVKLKRRDD
jgi:transcription initiation factor TFIID subunit 1